MTAGIFISAYVMVGAIYSFLLMNSKQFKTVLQTFESKFSSDKERAVAITLVMVIYIVFWLPLTLTALISK